MNTFWVTVAYHAFFGNVPRQFGSWLISILAGLGATPSNFTVPLTVAAVAGSIGAGAAAGQGRGLSSVVSLPPHPQKTRQSRVATNVLVFMLNTPLLNETYKSRSCYGALRPESFAVCMAMMSCRPTLRASAAAPTRRCSSG